MEITDCSICSEALRVKRSSIPVRKELSQAKIRLKDARRKKQKSTGIAKETLLLQAQVDKINLQARGVMLGHDRCAWCGMLFGESHLAIPGGMVLGRRACGLCVAEFAKMGPAKWRSIESTREKEEWDV